MKKTLRKVIVVKRFITFVGLFCLLIVCLTGQAQIKEKNWNRIPENQKTAFLVSGPDNQVMYIQCFISTLENWRLLLEEQWEEGKESTTGVQSLLEALFPGQTILFVWVTNGPRAQSFSPTNFVFTQGKQQYEVSLSDIYPLDKQFVGGEVEPYAVVKGFIAIPEGIDLTKPFMIRYGEAFGVIAQAQQGPGTTTPVQPPTRPGVPSGPIRVPGDYPTISAALQAAPEGAEIRVSRGTYRGDLLITRPVALIGEEGAVIQGNLIIQGAQNVTLNTVEIRGRVEIRNSTDVTISRVHVSDSPSIGVLIEDSTATISECQIEGSAEVGVDISFGGRVILHDCEIAGSGGDGVRVGFGTQARIVNTTIRDSSGDGLEITGATVELLGNRFVDNRGYGINAHSGATLLGERNRGQGNELGLASEGVPRSILAVIKVPEEMSLGEAIRRARETPILLSPGQYEISSLVVGDENELVIWGTSAEPTECVIVLTGEGVISDRGLLRLENLTLEGGITVYGYLTASNVVFQGGAGVILGEAWARLTDCLITGGSFDGLSIWGEANATLTRCIISENHKYGLGVYASASATLTGCTVSGNNKGGLEMSGSARVTLTNSTISGNGGDGLIAENSTHLTLTNCTVSKNGDAGLRMGDSAQVVLTSCTVTANRADGLYVTDSTQASLTDCQVFANGRDGLALGAAAQVTVMKSYIYAHPIGGGVRFRCCQLEAQVKINRTWISLNRFGIDSNYGGEVVGEGNWVVENLYDFYGYSPDPTFLATEPPKLPWSLEDRVEVCPNCEVKSLALALARVRPGGTVYIRAGTYHAAVITDRELTLSGEGADQTIIETLRIGGSARVTIAHCTISGSDWAGLSVHGAAQVNLTDCIISENGEYGLLVLDSAQVTLTECTVSGNGEGLRITDSTQVTLTDCTISENGEGLEIVDSAQVTLTDCIISENSNGVLLERGSPRVELVRNRFFDNKRYGIMGSTPSAEVTGRDNEFRGNWLDLLGYVSSSVRIPLVPETDRTELSVPGDYPTIQEALDAIAPGGTITVAPGTYETSLTIWKPVTIQGAGRDQTILRAGVSIIAGVSGVVIERLAIGSSVEDGLLIYGQAELHGLAIFGNGDDGLVLRGSAQVILTDCTISENDTGLVITNSARVTLTGCSISGNRNGLYVSTSASAIVVLTDCTILENRWWGLYVLGQSQIVLTDCTISKNGKNGLRAFALAEVKLENCVIESNAEDGILVLDEVQITVRNSIIRHNAEWGVEAYLEKCGRDSNAFTGEVILQNNKIYGNGRGDVCLPDLCIPEGTCE